MLTAATFKLPAMQTDTTFGQHVQRNLGTSHELTCNAGGLRGFAAAVIGAITTVQAYGSSIWSSISLLKQTHMGTSICEKDFILSKAQYSPSTNLCKSLSAHCVVGVRANPAPIQYDLLVMLNCCWICSTPQHISSWR